MQSLRNIVLFALLCTAPALADETAQADGPAADAATTTRIPAGQASGYPPAGGKGPGTGHGYRQNQPGPGRGAPNYQGGREAAVEAAGTVPAVEPAASGTQTETAAGEISSVPDVADDSGATDAATAAPAAATGNATGASTPAATEIPAAAPGPYGNIPLAGRPYHRGRGYGYGRHRRGYGYGYPGYRGLGGGRYPHHRQFGNPPLTPAQPPATDSSSDPGEPAAANR